MVKAIKVWYDYPYSLLWFEITMNKYIILFCQNTSTQNKQPFQVHLSEIARALLYLFQNSGIVTPLDFYFDTEVSENGVDWNRSGRVDFVLRRIQINHL